MILFGFVSWYTGVHQIIKSYFRDVLVVDMVVDMIQEKLKYALLLIQIGHWRRHGDQPLHGEPPLKCNPTQPSTVLYSIKISPAKKKTTPQARK